MRVVVFFWIIFQVLHVNNIPVRRQINTESKLAFICFCMQRRDANCTEHYYKYSFFHFYLPQ